MPDMDSGRIEYGEKRGPDLPLETNLDRIRRRAFEIWEAEGRPEGRHREHWLQAEREILGDSAGP
ncbi:MAG: DUF2934 domain-containing protein [Magnetospirillum sp.]|nr:DUF2934 domain-containing protein [Magnetospirillum sp.]